MSAEQIRWTASDGTRYWVLAFSRPSVGAGREEMRLIEFTAPGGATWRTTYSGGPLHGAADFEIGHYLGMAKHRAKVRG